MGFRSNFIVDYSYTPWPEWFREKWENRVYFPESGRGTIASKDEAKIYLTWRGLEEDIQKVIVDSGEDNDSAILIWLHECGGVTKATITKDDIYYTEPSGWGDEEEHTHHYCYGCSETEKTAGL